MVEIVSNCFDKYNQYFGDGIYLTLYFISIIVLVLFEKEKNKKYLFIGQMILFTIIYWCPITAYIIAEYCIGTNVYWRMWWLLPITITIAYSFVKITQIKENVWERRIVTLLLGLMIVSQGTFIYNDTNFQKADNWLKINQDVIEICEAVKADAQEMEIEDRGIIVPNEFIAQIKQYDGIIRMPYGRDVLQGKKKKNIPGKIYEAINAEEPDAEVLMELAIEGEYQYLVYDSWVGTTLFEEAGFRFVKYVGEYSVYCIE